MTPRDVHASSLQAGDELAVGVDIGGTNTAVGVMTASGVLLQQTTLATNAFEGAQHFAQRLAGTIGGMLRNGGAPKEVRAIGIACPAVNAREGIVENPVNLGWGKVDFAGMVRRYYDVPIVLLNDGDAAAIGEHRFGAARGLSNFVMITLGTGMGGGIVVDGSLVRGANGTGGEIGHIIIAPGGRICGCGRLGCAETYVSATGVCRTVAELMAQHVMPSPLRDIPLAGLTAKRVSELAREGDALSRLAFEVTGGHLGRLLANLAAIFDPEAIVLYGGLVHAGELLVEPTLHAFQKNVLGRYENKVRILVSRLNDGQAPIIGAGSFALQRLTGDRAVSTKGPHPG